MGRNLATRRRARGWTQEQLADKLRVSAQYVGMVERGVQNPSVESLARYANAVGCTVRDLFDDAGLLEKPRIGRPRRSG